MDRFTLAVVAGVLVLVVAGLAAAAFARGSAAPPDLSTPSGVVLAYVQAVQRNDGSAAWDLLASQVKARNNRDEFLARLGSHGDRREYLTTEDERLDGEGASVVLVRTYPGSGGLFSNNTYSTRATVRLVHEPVGWRITVPPDPYVLMEIRKGGQP